MVNGFAVRPAARWISSAAVRHICARSLTTLIRKPSDFTRVGGVEFDIIDINDAFLDLKVSRKYFMTTFNTY
jgi:hypothetical protein